MSMRKGDPWAPNYNNHSQKQKMELNGKRLGEQKKSRFEVMMMSMMMALGWQ